jgi:hypothetical protein
LLASAFGNKRSSASRKTTNSVVAARHPVLRAADSPEFGWRIERTAANWAVMRSGWSVDPSSTTMIWSAGTLCPNALRTAASRKEAWLYVVMMIATLPGRGSVVTKFAGAAAGSGTTWLRSRVVLSAFANDTV